MAAPTSPLTQPSNSPKSPTLLDSPSSVVPMLLSGSLPSSIRVSAQYSPRSPSPREQLTTSMTSELAAITSKLRQRVASLENQGQVSISPLVLSSVETQMKETELKHRKELEELREKLEQEKAREIEILQAKLQKEREDKRQALEDKQNFIKEVSRLSFIVEENKKRISEMEIQDARLILVANPVLDFLQKSVTDSHQQTLQEIAEVSSQLERARKAEPTPETENQTAFLQTRLEKALSMKELQSKEMEKIALSNSQLKSRNEFSSTAEDGFSPFIMSSLQEKLKDTKGVEECFKKEIKALNEQLVQEKSFCKHTVNELECRISALEKEKEMLNDEILQIKTKESGFQQQTAELSNRVPRILEVPSSPILPRKLDFQDGGYEMASAFLSHLSSTPASSDHFQQIYDLCDEVVALTAEQDRRSSPAPAHLDESSMSYQDSQWEQSYQSYVFPASDSPILYSPLVLSVIEKRQRDLLNSSVAVEQPIVVNECDTSVQDALKKQHEAEAQMRAEASASEALLSEVQKLREELNAYKDQVGNITDRYFSALALSTKLSAAMSGHSISLDVGSLHEEAKKRVIAIQDWPIWLSKKLTLPWFGESL